jgi:hypothetical protein
MRLVKISRDAGAWLLTDKGRAMTWRMSVSLAFGDPVTVLSVAFLIRCRLQGLDCLVERTERFAVSIR